MADPPDHDATVHNPHDRLVKRIFTQPEAAVAELRLVLPTALVDALDWERLEVERSSFVDPELRLRVSDILYSIGVRGSEERVRVYVVMEHQSSPDPAMAARFLIYAGRVYEEYLARNKGASAVPWVVPVLLYQGATGWTLARRFSELLEPPTLGGAKPPIELRFEVDDLSESALHDRATSDQLARDRGLVLVELARTLLWLYHHPEATDGERAELIAQLRTIVARVWGPQAVRPFLVYFLSAFGSKSKARRIMLKAADPETRTMFMTIKDELIAQGKAAGVVEGRAAGRADGVLQGKAELVLRLLHGRGLPVDATVEQRVSACRDEAQLQRWFDRAVTASTLAEVFDD